MKFSIILPTYNVERYIRRCLLSCVNQTYDDLEIIVVDDCGQDDSIQQAEQFAKNDSRIKIIRNFKNMGTYHARRLGVDSASGGYVLFLDPDDELELNALELMLEKLKNNQDIVLYGVKSVPEKRFYQTKAVLPKIGDDELDVVKSGKIFSVRGFNLGTAGKLFRRDILKTAYFSLNIPESLRLVSAEDLLLFAEAMSLSTSVTVVDARLYIYHRNGESITQAITTAALKFRQEQMGFCINLLLARCDARVERHYIYYPVIDRLKVDRKKIDIKLNSSFLYNLSGYLFIIKKTKSFKYLLRMTMYVLSMKTIKLV